MSLALFPYKNGSQGAKALAEALDIKQIKRTGSKYKGSKDKLVINWGSSTMDDNVKDSVIINTPEAVALASNKLSFFNKIKEYNRNNLNWIAIPEFTTFSDDARYWLEEGYTVVARTILNGHSGAGIVLLNPGDALIDAPLYVMYEPKKQEYRVHVFMGEVVDVQRKARRLDVPDDQVDWKIRNHDNGFIYSRNEGLGDVPEGVKNHSLAAVKCCGLDFGAVDVIWNEQKGQAYVLEINTAPGMSGETLQGYRDRLSKIQDYKKETGMYYRDILNMYRNNPAEFINYFEAKR